MFEDHGSRPDDPQPVGLGWKLSHAIPGERMAWHDDETILRAEGTGALAHQGFVYVPID